MYRKNTWLAIVMVFTVLGGIAFLATASVATGSGSNVTIYDDRLDKGWQEQSWAVNADLKNTAPVQNGQRSVALTYDGAFGALYLTAKNSIAAAPGQNLHFWIHGGNSGNHEIEIYLVDSSGAKIEQPVTVTSVKESWQEITIPIADLGSPSTIGGILWQDASGGPQPVLYLDEISLTGGDAATPTATATEPVPTATATGPAPSPTSTPAPSAAVIVYSDALDQNWWDASWGTTVDFANSTPVHGGTHSMSVTYDRGFGAVSLRADAPLNGADYESLSFWINGGASADRALQVGLTDSSGAQTGNYVPVATTPDTWTQVNVPLANIGAPDAIGGLLLQDFSGTAQEPLYLDDVVFLPYVTGDPTPPPPDPTPGPTDAVIYGDSLASGWGNWSWSTSVDFSQTGTTQSGSSAMSVRYDGAWAGFYLHTDQAISLAGFTSLRFWIHGGATGERALRVGLADGATTISASLVALTAPAGTWSLFEIPLSELGGLTDVTGVVWQENSGNAQPAFYLDNVVLVSGDVPPPPPPPPGGGPLLAVDAGSVSHTIPDTIYGVNFVDAATAQELRVPVNRWGGNAATRYNWQNDTSNRASDWFFENIPNENANPGALPDGSSSDRFVEQNRATGTNSLLTVPLIGWTPQDRQVRCGFSVSLYGSQQYTDPSRPDCGNGVSNNGSNISGNNPADTSTAIGPPFIQAWLQHLVGKYGSAGQNGVRFYALDNEPMLWYKTHRDVHPDPVGYDEIRDLTYAYGSAVKSVDPQAQVMGPAVWGWSAYFFSAIDAASGNWSNPPDQNAHGGVPFIPWYLEQMKQYEQSQGTRILDYLDLHYYPQAPGVTLSTAGDASTQQLRLRSTRALWDPTYIDESWIGNASPGGAVQLLPRMREWVNNYYPGTKLAITEYNWGGLEHINGALAQADVLGIFGREGLDLATLWDPPTLAQPGAFAFRMYRNYDGQGSAFGDQSVVASSSDQEVLSVYAARRSSDGALTVIVVNKSGSAQNSTLQLSGVTAASGQVYRYDAGNLQAIQHLADEPVQSNTITMDYPANSITLLVIE